MSEKNRMIRTIIVIASLLLMLLLGTLLAITKNILFDIILHIYIRILLVPLSTALLRKCFKDQIKDSMCKAIALCTDVIALDLVLIDAFRYILFGGVSTVFFLPACLPLCYMIIMYYSIKDTGKDKTSGYKLTFWIGIPLLLLSLYFEIISFV